MDNKKMLQELIPKTVEIYGDALVSVILYGSVARGTQTEESDIDIALLLQRGESKEMKERMTDAVVDMELKYDKVLSVLRIDYQNFKLWEDTMPFYINMKKEGLILWPAA